MKRMSENLVVQYEALRNTFNVIEQDIDSIERVLLNVVKANNF